MGKYGVFEVPALVRATVDTCQDRCANLGDWFINADRESEGQREAARVVDMVPNHLALEGVL
jgi:hypothetical protein